MGLTMGSIEERAEGGENALNVITVLITEI